MKFNLIELAATSSLAEANESQLDEALEYLSENAAWRRYQGKGGRLCDEWSFTPEETEGSLCEGKQCLVNCSLKTADPGLTSPLARIVHARL